MATPALGGGQAGLRPAPAVPGTPAQQRRQDGGVQRHFGKIVLPGTHPEEVQDAQTRHRVDRAVQRLPALAPQRLDGPVERGACQQRQQQQRQRSDQDERPLGDVAQDVCQVKTHVEPAVAQQVQQPIEKHEQAQHAPKPRQLRRGREHAQRRDGQHQAQRPQRPVARGADQGFCGVGAQLVGGSGHHQPDQGKQAQHKHQGFGGGMEQEFAHGIGAPPGSRSPHAWRPGKKTGPRERQAVARGQ